jgi:hypothetical protein
MDKQYFEFAVGKDSTTDVRRLLVAPTGTFLRIDDVVETYKGTYKVMFVCVYKDEDDETVTGIKAALGQAEAERIVSRITSETIDWEVHPDDMDM